MVGVKGIHYDIVKLLIPYIFTTVTKRMTPRITKVITIITTTITATTVAGKKALSLSIWED